MTFHRLRTQQTTVFGSYVLSNWQLPEMRFSFISFQEMEPERSQFYVFIVGAGASYTKLLFKTPKFFHSKALLPSCKQLLDAFSPVLCMY